MCDLLIAEVQENGSIQSTVVDGEVREFAELNKETKKRREAQEDKDLIRQKQEEACRRLEACRLDRATRMLNAKKKAYMDLAISVTGHLALCVAVTLLARNHLLDVRVAWVAITLATGRVTYKLGCLHGKFPHA